MKTQDTLLANDDPAADDAHDPSSEHQTTHEYAEAPWIMRAEFHLNEIDLHCMDSGTSDQDHSYALLETGVPDIQVKTHQRSPAPQMLMSDNVDSDGESDVNTKESFCELIGFRQVNSGAFSATGPVYSLLKTCGRSQRSPVDTVECMSSAVCDSTYL